MLLLQALQVLQAPRLLQLAPLQLLQPPPRLLQPLLFLLLLQLAPLQLAALQTPQLLQSPLRAKDLGITTNLGRHLDSYSIMKFGCRLLVYIGFGVYWFCLSFYIFGIYTNSARQNVWLNSLREDTRTMVYIPTSFRRILCFFCGFWSFRSCRFFVLTPAKRNAFKLSNECERVFSKHDRLIQQT